MELFVGTNIFNNVCKHEAAIASDCISSLFTTTHAVHGDCDMPALEVPALFFAQGYISAYGDALYFECRYATIVVDRVR